MLDCVTYGFGCKGVLTIYNMRSLVNAEPLKDRVV
jgi:hypothetical protein